MLPFAWWFCGARDDPFASTCSWENCSRSLHSPHKNLDHTTSQHHPPPFFLVREWCVSQSALMENTVKLQENCIFAVHARSIQWRRTAPNRP